MTLKQTKITSTIIIFLLCLFTHFGYTIFPNMITSIFFPINESIWEHTKMLYTAIIISTIFDYIFLKKKNNIFISTFLASITSVISFLIIYLPLFNIFNNNTLINIIVLIISIITGQIVSYYILKKPDLKLNIISICGITLIYIIYGIFTYYPLNNYVFYDYSQNKSLTKK